ncbi:MAG: VIT and VWA domain-containing protein [Verrucomicrobiales bacterium]|nr:VIT and VWA domain-containing protein [Verrucomicrobiales bacterium]
MKKTTHVIHTILIALGLSAVTSESQAAGTLTPKGSPHAPIAIRDHHVQVTINNGFARTEVTQTFFNPNDVDLEAVYRFPLPTSASLSEVTLTIGEREIEGEVVERDQAKTIYESEKQAGNDAGLATKDGYQSFEFRVHPVRAQDETRIRIVYYQPLKIDTGIGRYLYPLEEGGTDDAAAASFWNPVHDKVEGNFSAEVILKSAWPVEDVRLPGYEAEAVTEKLGDGDFKITLDRPGQALSRDLVVYYRLAQELPGRVEVIPYRSGEKGEGTFMMVVTPGLDLQPLNQGADYVYVLDTSGSMASKLHTLTDGVSRVIGNMPPQDRFRIITFSNHAKDITNGWQTATPENVNRTIETVKNIKTQGSTNLYEGLEMAMKKLDDDRATSIVLVTDGVTNTGIVDPVKFHELTRSHDLRIFGFLLGNSANWPLMRTVCDSSGGFYSGVSNADDILGQILQAKSKILFECLHDAEFEIKGVRTMNVTGQIPGKVYRGEQLVLSGQYEKGGEAELVFKARLTGEDKTYRTSFTFPEVDTDNPEIERLWALDQIEQFELQTNRGEMPAGESENAIRDLGLKYQLVTDETSMLVLSDEAFERHGVARNNRQRVAIERKAQSTRAAAPKPTNYRVDSKKPLTTSKAPRISPPSSSGGGGGGALPPFAVILMLLFSGLAAKLGIRKQQEN